MTSSFTATAVDFTPGESLETFLFVVQEVIECGCFLVADFKALLCYQLDLK